MAHNHDHDGTLECRECDGNGYFIRGADERECPHCEGTGERAEVTETINPRFARVLYTRREVAA